MKKILFSFLALSCIVIFTGNVFGMTPTFPNNAKFTRGVGNTTYYVDSSASGYTNQANSAAYNWEVTGYGWNPIYMTAVSSNWASHIDIYGFYQQNDSNLNDNTIAYTTFYDINANLVTPKKDIPSRNYFYTEIIMNKSISESTIPKVIKHEMGHAFGLAHDEYNHYSIMYPALIGSMVDTVQAVDNETINFLY